MEETKMAEKTRVPQVRVNYKNGVNVRKSPEPDSDVLFVASKGTKFQTRGTEGDWTRVVLPNEVKKYGYVMTQYLSEC